MLPGNELCTETFLFVFAALSGLKPGNGAAALIGVLALKPPGAEVDDPYVDRESELKKLDAREALADGSPEFHALSISSSNKRSKFPKQLLGGGLVR